MIAVYAYRFTVHPEAGRSAVCAGRGSPDTGWVHYRGPEFRVVVSDDRATFDLLNVPGTHVEQYTGDESTINFFDAWPMLKRRKAACTLNEWLRPFDEWARHTRDPPGGE